MKTLWKSTVFCTSKLCEIMEFLRVGQSVESTDVWKHFPFSCNNLDSRIDEAPYHRSMVFHPFQCSYFIVLLIILQRIRYFLQQSFFISKCEDMISKIRKISEKNYVGHCWLSINNHLNFLERELLVFIWFTKVSEDNFSYSQHTVI